MVSFYENMTDQSSLDTVRESNKRELRRSTNSNENRLAVLRLGFLKYGRPSIFCTGKKSKSPIFKGERCTVTLIRVNFSGQLFQAWIPPKIHAK
tara:strand:+ start:86 stop:367 length:282 start_codon:yes stop_codon:yes gene_type:complete